MLKSFTLAGSAVLLGLVGCAADVAPLDTGDHGPAPGAEQASATPQQFEVQLRGDPPTVTTVIPAIVAAAHDHLHSACEDNPAASIRIYNPMASGDYADLSCASVLSGEGTGETSAALSSEPIGKAREKLTPIGGLLCSLAGAIATAATAKACSDWRGPNSQFCTVGGFTNSTAWAFACYLMF